jgi:hypothetical protein
MNKKHTNRVYMSFFFTSYSGPRVTQGLAEMQTNGPVARPALRGILSYTRWRVQQLFNATMTGSKFTKTAYIYIRARVL